MAGILPPWVAEDGPEAAAAKLRDPALRERMRNESDRYWRFIHKGEWERVYFQATPAAPRARRAELPADLGAARQGPVGVLPRHPRRRRRGLRVDPHGRDALHRRAPGGDDRPSALLPRRRHVHGPGHGAAERDHEAPARLRRPRPLPHPPRARAGHAAPGGGDPEDDEHAGGALRPLGSRPPAGGLQRRRRGVRLRRARRRLDDARIRPCTHAGSSTSSSTASSSSTAPSTRARARAVTCCDGDAAPIDLRSDLHAPPTDEMWEAMRAAAARLGDVRRGSFRQRAAGAGGRPARQGGGALGAHLRDGQPGRAPDDRAAWKHRRPGSLLARPHLGGDGDRGDRRPRARGRSGRRTGGSTRRRWRRRSSRRAR